MLVRSEHDGSTNDEPRDGPAGRDAGDSGADGSAGESDTRLLAVAGWRKASCFTDAERAALALTEAVTRLSDRDDPVPDDVWQDAARHYDETTLAALIIAIAA